MTPIACKPELLAPAGSEESLHAAVENGADAVYFGIAGGNFNARVRAKNIPLPKLGETVESLHRRGVKAYLTLNTLAFAGELPQIETLLREFAECRVDAILVQDLGIAALAHRLCPGLTLHASTQMSLSSAEAFSLASRYGIRRVVLPRELSIEQIQTLRRNTDLELEAFVHGALCISFSGQCYASLNLGGRSANRGCCAQPCRMSYDIFGEESPPRPIFSPTDLAALPLLRQMRDAGVCAFKIEGRLKPPEYVAETTRIYRNAIDAMMTDTVPPDYTGDLERLAITFSRGFSTGWLEGIDARRLVPGNIVAHRGTPLGTVVEVRRDAAVVSLGAPVKRGDGVLFENENEPDRSQGGRVYEIFHRRESVKEAKARDKVLLTFANGAIDAEHVAAGQSVRKTDDPRIEREIRKSLRPKRLQKKTLLHLNVHGVVGELLQISVNAENGIRFEIQSDAPLEEAKKHPLTAEVLREQLGRLGETEFNLGELDAVLDGKAMVPLSILGQLRRQMIETLQSRSNSLPKPEPTPIVFGPSLQEQRAGFPCSPSPDSASPIYHVLFREAECFSDGVTLARYVDTGCQSFYAELRSYKEFEQAADSVRAVGAEFVAVAPRILKPSETKFLKFLADLTPDAVLVRNLGALAFFSERNISCIADFSFNIVNDLAFRQLEELGNVLRITPGPDLDEERMSAFLKIVPAERLEWIVQGRSPLFTMEHCLWKANLVPLGQPCEKICRTRSLRIRDRYGAIHPVRSDVHCRNIVENSQPISPPQCLPQWIEQGLQHLRIEHDGTIRN
ncbi:MAG: U32 family peptidase [Planctomycetaceae bacterium]|nr:U32 family peptidase [Planctomycetaceae bacterium]